jgi:hypothetical protein
MSRRQHGSGEEAGGRRGFLAASGVVIDGGFGLELGTGNWASVQPKEGDWFEEV